MSDLITTVTDQDFDTQVLAADRPVLVDFWAAWCAPCRALESTLEDVAETYGHSLKILKLDIEQAPETAARYDVRAIPVLVLIVGAQERNRISGALSRTRLCLFIDNNV